MKQGMIKITDIANALDISPGTVDRALHDRKGISLKTKEMILKKAKEMGYSPNIAGRLLAMKESSRIAVVLITEPEYFWSKVRNGVDAAIRELTEFGVKSEIFSSPTHDVEYQRTLIDSLINEDYSGIAIIPSHPTKIDPSINSAVEVGIPVITINSDAPGSKRFCYIGQNMKLAGRIAGELLGSFLQDRGGVALLTGFSTVWSQLQRVEGFKEVCAEYHPDLDIIGTYDFHGDEKRAYTITSEVLERKDLSAIYVTNTTGMIGAGQAIHDAGRHDIIMVGYDLNDRIRKLLQDGIVKATIWQDPYSQGYYAVKLLFESITKGLRPEKERIYTKMRIIVRENMDIETDENISFRF